MTEEHDIKAEEMREQNKLAYARLATYMEEVEAARDRLFRAEEKLEAARKKLPTAHRQVT